MKYVFGPVPSSRLGQSLGIDPIPLKTCNWNCIYCQLGRTVPLTGERAEFTSRHAILAEIQEVLSEQERDEIDWVTFVGSGEPTLHSSLGWLIRRVKVLTDLPVAVITNGSLLYQPEVRWELCAADAVLPSFDAGNQRMFRKINRPWPKPTFEEYHRGLVSFRKEYRGPLWVEVMLVHGVNDGEGSLKEIAAALNRVKPDLVHVALPNRPPAEPWVKPATEESVQRALAILGENAQALRPARGLFELTEFEGIAEAVLNIVARHPMQESELLAALQSCTPEEVNRAIEELSGNKQLQVIERDGLRFWGSAQARYASRNL
jgi:wyosine [tRNA(Phe)-imidazoG37] synthetase (radical SAM superfamily)